MKIKKYAVIKITLLLITFNLFASVEYKQCMNDYYECLKLKDAKNLVASANRDVDTPEEELSPRLRKLFLQIAEKMPNHNEDNVSNNDLLKDVRLSLNLEDLRDICKDVIQQCKKIKKD